MHNLAHALLQQGDHAQAAALFNLGSVAGLRRHHARAAELYEESKLLFRQPCKPAAAPSNCA